MKPFAFFRPETVPEAVAALARAPGGRLIAGGMSLLPAMKTRTATPSRLVALDGVPGLEAIRREAGRLRVGALARHADVAQAPLVRAAVPVLASLAGRIGDPQVRNRGTLGGALATNDPAGDYPAALLALDAVVETDRRALDADAFLRGPRQTALAADEIILYVLFREPSRAAYVKFANPATGYALVGVMVAETAAGVRVAVTGAGTHAFRMPAMEAALSRSFTAEAIAGAALPDDVVLVDNHHASAAYRAHLVGVMAQRAVAEAG